MTRKLIQIIVISVSFFSIGFNYFYTYPKWFEDILKKESFVIFFLCHAGFLFSYFAFFLWRRMPLAIYAVLAIIFIIFFNLFFLSFKSPFAPFGILTIVISLVLLVIVEKKTRQMSKK